MWCTTMWCAPADPFPSPSTPGQYWTEAFCLYVSALYFLQSRVATRSCSVMHRGRLKKKSCMSECTRRQMCLICWCSICWRHAAHSTFNQEDFNGAAADLSSVGKENSRFLSDFVILESIFLCFCYLFLIRWNHSRNMNYYGTCITWLWNKYFCFCIYFHPNKASNSH